MKFRQTELPDVLVIEPDVFGDDRGFFLEVWRSSVFAEAGLDAFVQENHSKSVQGVLRGLHYQLRQPQGKLVRVIRGEVFDVAVDLRRHSPTFGQWTSRVLSAANKQMLWIPAGFAHGFYVLSPEAEFVYKCTDYYAPAWERAIRWDDPQIGINWPLLDHQPPLLSEKDATALSFQEAEYYYEDRNG